MTAIFSDFVKNIMEVFMDDFSVYRGSFDLCFQNLTKVLYRCDEVNLCVELGKVPLHGAGRSGIGSCHFY